jgi:hypothetical protein
MSNEARFYSSIAGIALMSFLYSYITVSKIAQSSQPIQVAQESN